MKKTLISVAKWIWFGLLMLVAFGYMASGLSDQSADRRSEPAGATETGLGQSSDSGEAADGPASDMPESRSDSLRAVVDAVNQARTEQLDRRGIFAAEQADWMTVCRRL